MFNPIVAPGNTGADARIVSPFIGSESPGPQRRAVLAEIDAPGPRPTIRACSPRQAPSQGFRAELGRPSPATPTPPATIVDTLIHPIHPLPALGSPNSFGYTSDCAIFSQSSLSVFSTPPATPVVIIPLHVTIAVIAKAAKRLWFPGSRCEGK